VISLTVFAEALDVFGITIKRHYPAERAYESRCPECERSQVRAHVVDHIAGSDHRGDGILYAGFVLTTPETGFLRDTQAHPESLRKTGLDLHPGGSAPQSATLDELLSGVELDLCVRPTTKRRGDDTLLEGEISAIDEEVEKVQGSRDAQKNADASSECTAAIEQKAKRKDKKALEAPGECGAFRRWEGMTSGSQQAKYNMRRLGAYIDGAAAGAAARCRTEIRKRLLQS
jgi:hypothetical protein